MYPDTGIQPTIEILTVNDETGRKFLIRRPTALDILRLFKAAGPVLAQNEPWLALAGLAFSVVSIDDVPVPSPTNEAQLEAIVARLGKEGVDAISNVLDQSERAQNEAMNVGNLLGTLS